MGYVADDEDDDDGGVAEIDAGCIALALDGLHGMICQDFEAAPAHLGLKWVTYGLEGV